MYLKEAIELRINDLCNEKGITINKLSTIYWGDTLIDSCEVKNCTLISDRDNVGGISGLGKLTTNCTVENTTIQGRNTFVTGSEGSTQDTITNCKRDGVAVTQ